MASVPKGDESKDIAMVIVVVAVVAIVCIGALLAMPRTSDESGNDQEDSVLVVMTITSARWEELDASGLSASIGCLCLWISATVANNASESVSVSSMYVDLRTTAGAEYSPVGFWGPDAVAAAGVGAFGMVFDIPVVATPQMLVYNNSWDLQFSATVPTPSALVPDVVMEVSDASLRLYGLDDLVVWTDDMRYLWLTFTITNQWTEDLDTDGLAFDVIGSDGEEEMCLTKDGPDLVASGATGTITANFIVDADFVPVTLTYAMLFGPSASADIPPLSSSN